MKLKKFLQVSLLAIVFLVGTFNKVEASTTAVTVTASSTSMVYGGTVPPITAAYNPNITPATPDTCSTVVTSTSPVGSYASTCSGDSNPLYTFIYIDGSVYVTQATPTITWPSPADATTGTALSSTQLNATASVPGTFAYTPNIGTVLSVGANQTLSATFTPTDTTNYATATGTATVNVADQQVSNSGGSTPSPTLNTQVSVDVPASCSATDTDGVVHNYPQDGSSNSYLAICALEAAIKNGSISNVQFSNKYPTLGLFIATINGVTADPNSQYWAIYNNGTYQLLGATSLQVISGDILKFQLNDFSDKSLGDQVTINIQSLISNTTTSVSSSGGHGQIISTTPVSPTKPIFDTKKSLNFLTSQQKDDGSFGQDLYTDWAALALASGNYQDQMLKLDKYFVNSKFENPSLTDSERHAMALMSLGLNPYSTNGENFIKNITASFDGKQFGDTNQDNDDIFALIVLQNAGYSQNDQMISSDINFILSAQIANGSWDSSVDMTGAAMEALSPFNQNDQVRAALTQAEGFLNQSQKDDGSWNDSASSTAWAIEGILAQGEKTENWTKNSNGNTPLDYLATVQDTDGGIKDENAQNKIWETAYVASALSGKTWNQTMQKFDKQETPSSIEAPKITTKKHAVKKMMPTINNSGNVVTTPKTKNSANQYSATAINAIATDTPQVNTQTETPKKNWFSRLIGSIFGSR